MVTTTETAAYLDPHAPLETRAKDLLDRLTLEEKVGLMAGAASFTLMGVERLGVPEVRVADGPTGVRSNEGEPATVFPVGVAMASTWNPDVAREVGAAIGREALALNNRVVLAPTINIVRTPLWGRNFETYSEDPYLAGVLGSAYVKGLQGEGVGASLKHYAVNNQEENRMTVSVELDERTLREVYLAAFERVVKEANPWTVMASYNKVRGVYATESKLLMEDILKDEWGFGGVAVSDWGAVHATAAAANGGTDLEMPGPARWFGDKLVAVVRDGEVPERRIDDAALRMCRPHPAHRRAGRRREAGRRAAHATPSRDRRASRSRGGRAAEERRRSAAAGAGQPEAARHRRPQRGGPADSGRWFLAGAHGPAGLDPLGAHRATGRQGRGAARRWRRQRARAADGAGRDVQPGRGARRDRGALRVFRERRPCGRADASARGAWPRQAGQP